MRGSDLLEPWPISAPVLRIVTVPSGEMRTQAPTGMGLSLEKELENVKANVRPAPALRHSLRVISMSGLLRCALDRGDDAVVGAAAADVAVHVGDDLLAARLRI